MAIKRGPFGIPIPTVQQPSLGNIGYVPPQPDPGIDLSFLNDPNNPYYTQQQAAPQQQSYATSPEPSYYSAPSGEGTVAAPVKIIEQSPEWLAYINALGLQKNQFAADIARQREIAGANAAFAKEGVGPQFDQARRGITASAEGRGMARSGQLQRNLAESRGQQTRAYQGIQQNLSNTLSDLENSAAQKTVELDSQRAQQYASMIGSGYVSNGLTDYLKNLGK